MITQMIGNRLLDINLFIAVNMTRMMNDYSAGIITQRYALIYGI